MIRYIHGDIFESGASLLINPVNCVGVSGAGLALKFRQKYPENFRSYRAWCDGGRSYPGTIYISKIQPDGKIIGNMTTKKHWREKSNILDIIAGLAALRAFFIVYPGVSCALPKVGCGLGGLDWQEVRKAVDHLFDLPKFNINLEVYE